MANKELASIGTEHYYSCCGKEICGGCVYSFNQSGNNRKCPYCNADRKAKTEDALFEEMMNRVEANDATSIYRLAHCYHQGLEGVQQDHAKAIELYGRAAELGYSEAHYLLSDVYYKGGDLKKAKFHGEAAAMAGNEAARYNLGSLENNYGNMVRAVWHWTIAASAGEFGAMQP
jgi:TPR repeat protein